MEVCRQLHSLATLSPGKEPWYSLDRRLWQREKSLSLPGTKTQSSSL